MLRIGLVQMHCPKGEVDANLQAIEAHVREAVERGVQILCFPEMSITGYLDPSRWPEAVLTLDSPAIRRFVGMTAGHDLVVLAGLVEANPAGKPFITQVVAHSGSLLGVYRKVTIDEEEAPWFAPGRGVPAFHHGSLMFGPAICADINNAEVFAASAAQGVHLVFEAAAPGLHGAQETRDWRTGFEWWRGECHAKLGRYARQHGMYIAVATQAGRTVDEDFPGGGYVFAPDGRCLAESADWSPGVLYADLPLPVAG
jgi:predicted amidohydrolase